MKADAEKLIIEFDDERDALMISHANRDRFPFPLVEIRRSTLRDMDLVASQFIGERIVLLTPKIKELFLDYLWSEDGKPPGKKFKP